MTPRSRRGPTALHLAREPAWFIIRLAGRAQRCWSRLTSLPRDLQPRYPHSMAATARAALAYFAMVLAAGFLLGTVRIPFVVPRLGERWAELAEMPIMAIVIFVSAGFVLRRFPAVQTRGRSLVVGFMALALVVGAELALAVAMQSQSLSQFIASRDKVSGSVYLAMLVVFALMPRLRLAHDQTSDVVRSVA